MDGGVFQSETQKLVSWKLNIDKYINHYYCNSYLELTPNSVFLIGPTGIFYHAKNLKTSMFEFEKSYYHYAIDSNVISLEEAKRLCEKFVKTRNFI